MHSEDKFALGMTTKHLPKRALKKKALLLKQAAYRKRHGL